MATQPKEEPPIQIDLGKRIVVLVARRPLEIEPTRMAVAFHDWKNVAAEILKAEAVQEQQATAAARNGILVPAGGMSRPM